MGEFFRGWRQKTGIVTLVLACAFLAGWVRSLTICDGFAMTLTKSRYSVRSYRHMVLWDHQHVDEGKLYHSLFNYFSVVIADLTQPHRDPLETLREREWCFIAGDFYIATGYDRAGHPSSFVPKPGPPVRYSVVIAQTPYWSIVIPLTVISFWLLLSKPRKLTQKKIIEPIRVEGI